MPAPKTIYRAALDARASRRAAAGVPRRWDVGAVAAQLRDQVRHAADLGLLDPRLLDDYQADLESLIERALSGGLVEAGRRVGETAAERVFGDRDYGNRLDRQLATGASAVGELAVEEALTVAVGYAVLRLSLVPEIPSPVWPGRADGSGEAAGVDELGGDDDPADPDDEGGGEALAGGPAVVESVPAASSDGRRRHGGTSR